MKKGILFVLMLFCYFASTAQIVIEKQNSNPLIKISHGLYYHQNCGKITYSIMMNTTNQFDEPFAIGLGATKAEAIQSIGELIRVCRQAVGTNVIFDSHYGYKVELNIFDILGTKSCVLSSKQHAGIVTIKTRQLEKLIDKINYFVE